MAYSEKDGQVVLTMSRDDYAHVLIALGIATGTFFPQRGAWMKLVNRINDGNPEFHPYFVKEGKDAA